MAKKMKVAIVHSYYSTKEPSGENAVVQAQVELLETRGLDVRVIAAATDDQRGRVGYAAGAAYRVATGYGNSPMKALKAFGPDIVHVHNLFPNWSSAWLKDWKGPLVATLHNFRPVCSAATLFRDGKTCTLCPDSSSVNAVRYACYRDSRLATLPLSISTRGGATRNALLNRADRLIVLSQRAETLYARFGVDSEKLVRIPNFVPDVGYSPLVQPGKHWVYIGRLTQEKGLMSLLKHWPEDEELHIYGDGPLRTDIEKYLGSSIQYRGLLPPQSVPGILEGSAGLVFPSEWAEGLPLIYLEALASGRAVVAKSGNSAADDILTSGAGAVFEDWGLFSLSLNEVRDKADHMRLLARRHYEEAFVDEIWFDSMMRLYESVSEEANA